MRIVFMGTGEIGLPTLQALIADRSHSVVGVVTQPDKPVGRKQVLTPPRVKTVALEHGLPVLQAERIRGAEALRAVAAWQADVIVVIAYGQILPRAVLELPGVACLNLHASLLPRHRGAAPIQAAIRAGDTRSGMTVMYVDEGLDTGDILLQRSFDLDPEETGGSLHDRLAEIAPGALSEALALLERGTAPRAVQDAALATHTGKLTREDGFLDWSQPSTTLDRLIRAYDPWPGTVTWLGQEGEPRRRLKVFPPVRVRTLAPPPGPPGSLHLDADTAAGKWLVATGEGGLEISEIQLEGKRRVSVAQFCKGNDLGAGARLYSQPA